MKAAQKLLTIATAMCFLLAASGCGPELDSTDPRERQKAIRNGRFDQSTLEYVAKRDRDPGVREAAATKLTDQRLLANIAYGDDDGNVRYAALRRLVDEPLLAEYAIKYACRITEFLMKNDTLPRVKTIPY